jgi:hypothetical protein
MTAAHEAVLNLIHRHSKNRTTTISLTGLSLMTGVADDQIPQIIADLRARGEWPEGLRVVGEGQR